MDDSNIPSDKRYVLLNKELADLIDEMNPEDLNFLLKIIKRYKDCACGCRGSTHITVATDDGREHRLQSRSRRQTLPAPDFEAQFHA